MKINESFSSYIKDVDKLRNIVRYQTAPRISSETVAEHSFYVAVYLIKLQEYYNFDITKALQLALLHDFTEAYISDVPHPVKAAHPELEKALNEAERDVCKQKLNEDIANWMTEFNERSSPEGLVCALCDTLSVVSYSKYEVLLGNETYMKDVFKGVTKRYMDIINQMQPLLKEGHTSQEVISEVWDFFNTDNLD